MHFGKQAFLEFDGKIGNTLKSREETAEWCDPH